MATSPVRNAKEDKLFYLIKTVARHSAVYGVMNFLGRATSLVLVPLYVRTWPTAEYGTFELFTVSQPLLQAVLLLGFNSALVRYYTLAETAAERKAYFRTAFTTVAAFTALVLLVLFLAAGDINRLVLGRSPAVAGGAGLWRLLFLAVLFDTLTQMFLALFRAEARPFRYSWVNLAQFLLTLVLNVYLVGVRRMGLHGALIGILIANLCGTLLGFVLAFGEAGFAFSRKRFDRLASFGLPLVVSALAFSALNNSDRFFLKAYAGAEELGIYALGYKVGLIMSVLMNAFVVAWPPMMYRIFREEHAREIYARVLTYYTFVAGVVFLAIASFSGEIVGLLHRPAYAPAAGIIWLILLAYLLQGVYYVLSVGVTVTDQVKWIAIVVGAGAVVNIAANLLLIPRFGMNGAAWATLISFAALALMMWLAAERQYAIPWEKGRLARLLVLGAPALYVNLAVIGHGSWARAGLKLVVLGLFVLALLLTRFFSKEEILRAGLLVSRVGKRRSVTLP
jgi:O-antigen/teichoic acid export membrane protein